MIGKQNGQVDTNSNSENFSSDIQVAGKFIRKSVVSKHLRGVSNNESNETSGTAEAVKTANDKKDDTDGYLSIFKINNELYDKHRDVKDIREIRKRYGTLSHIEEIKEENVKIWKRLHRINARSNMHPYERNTRAIIPIEHKEPIESVETIEPDKKYNRLQIHQNTFDNSYLPEDQPHVLRPCLNETGYQNVSMLLPHSQCLATCSVICPGHCELLYINPNTHERVQSVYNLSEQSGTDVTLTTDSINKITDNNTQIIERLDVLLDRVNDSRTIQDESKVYEESRPEYHEEANEHTDKTEGSQYRYRETRKSNNMRDRPYRKYQIPVIEDDDNHDENYGRSKMYMCKSSDTYSIKSEEIETNRTEPEKRLTYDQVNTDKTSEQNEGLVKPTEQDSPVTNANKASNKKGSWLSSLLCHGENSIEDQVSTKSEDKEQTSNGTGGESEVSKNTHTPNNRTDNRTAAKKNTRVTTHSVAANDKRVEATKGTVTFTNNQPTDKNYVLEIKKSVTGKPVKHFALRNSSKDTEMLSPCTSFTNVSEQKSCISPEGSFHTITNPREYGSVMHYKQARQQNIMTRYKLKHVTTKLETWHLDNCFDSSSCVPEDIERGGNQPIPTKGNQPNTNLNQLKTDAIEYTQSRNNHLEPMRSWKISKPATESRDHRLWKGHLSKDVLKGVNIQTNSKTNDTKETERSVHGGSSQASANENQHKQPIARWRW